MKRKPTTTTTRKSDVPYDAKDRKATLAFWGDATPHKGVTELRAKRGRPKKPPEERKEQIALRLDADVLAW